MSDGMSEQLLKALERSQGKPNDILRQAAAIAGITFNNHENCYQRNNGKDSAIPNTFREQWLLKWAVKRLIEASKQENSSQHLVTNALTWSFFSYLLTVIPREDCLEILLERNFTQVLTNANNILIKDQSTVSSKGSITRPSTNVERSHKRRRLSTDVTNDPVGSSELPHTSDNGALLQFLCTVLDWGTILRPERVRSSSTARHVLPAWCESVKSAADFVGSILKSIHTQLDSTVGERSRILLASTATLWLRLWHTLATSTNTTDKATLHRHFNAACLGPSLDVYGHISGGWESSLLATQKEIEKQIALFTILPLRASFNTKLAAVWKLETGVVSWQDIEPTLMLIQDQLGSSLHTETLIDQKVVFLPNPSWVSYLVSIASRLTPREDVRRKQRETPFIQALTICLAHLGFSREMPKMQKGKSQTLQPTNDAAPPRSDASVRWPDELLQTMATENISFSTPIKEYLTASVLSWRSRPLPLKLLLSIVELGPDTFVPSIGGRNAGQCLNTLLLAIADLGIIDVHEYQQIIERVIGPIMEAFVLARDFDGWIDIWMPNLEEASRIRTMASFPSHQTPTALLWDDEEIFDRFTNLCRLNAVMTLDRALLESSINEMRPMSDRIGPTTDIFAKLAVLESILRARGSSLLRHEDFQENLTIMADLLVGAIQERSDFQGQRWRLWSMLITLRRSDARLDRFDLVTDTVQAVCERLCSKEACKVDELPQSQRSALLMEQYMIFILTVEGCVSRRNTNTEEQKSDHRILSTMLEQLANTIQQLRTIRPSASAPGPSSEADTLWNGKINTLRSTAQLATNQLGFLAGKLNTVDIQSEVWAKLVLSIEEYLAEVNSGTTRSSSNKNPSNLIIAFLSSLHQSKDENRKADVDNQHMNDESLLKEARPSSVKQTASQPLAEALAANALSQINLTKPSVTQMLFQTRQELTDINAILTEGIIVSNVTETDLRGDSTLAENMARGLRLEVSTSSISSIDFVLRLETCMLILKLQSGVVNQAAIDNLLREIATSTSASAKIETSDAPETGSQSKHAGVAIFDRLVAILGLLLARYRRRLTGRTHLLLPVLQNLLRCFFYTPSRTYIYQNAATARQKQAFRSSLPSWLNQEALPISSAVRYVKILSTISNPSTASARSAHRGQRKAASATLELNDETKRAKRIASQYMQYLIMEYARCTLDGVIQQEVRESLMPGLFSIVDAMDKDLMRALNAAMDPSSRAMFKGLYDDWVRYWKWNQT